MKFLLAVLLFCAASNAFADGMRWATPEDMISVRRAVHEHFTDPSSLRDTELSQIMFYTGDNGKMNMFFCVKANAKNQMGGYTGEQPYIFMVSGDGQSTASNGAAADPVCAAPELQYRSVSF